MLPIKLVRSITNDRRSQDVGMAISVTNERAGYEYLTASARRIRIEKLARSIKEAINPGPEDRWVENEWSQHWRSKKRRMKGKL